MRIAVVTDVVMPFRQGGMERRVYEIGRRLARRGHDVHVVTMRWWEGPRVIELEGMTVHGICPPFELYGGRRRSIRQALAFAMAAARYIAGGHVRPDVLEVQAFPYFPALACRAVTRTPMVVTWHEVWGSYWLRYLGAWGPAGMAIERLCARVGRLRIVVSDEVEARLLQLAAAPPTAVVPGGVDTEAIATVPAASDAPELVFVGRLLAHKGGDLLLQALALLRARGKMPTLAIIGDGPERGRLEALARRLGVASQVRWLGRVPDCRLFAVLKGARALVLPSTREGFGLVVLEANACGRPAIVVDHPLNSSRHLVTDGRNGFVCRPTPGDLAHAIAIALQQGPDMEEECRAAAAAYSWEASADGAERELYRVIEARPSHLDHAQRREEAHG